MMKSINQPKKLNQAIVDKFIKHIKIRENKELEITMNYQDDYEALLKFMSELEVIPDE